MLKSERPALSPIHFLIIFGQEDYIQLNYPEDFFYEQSIRELILPRRPEEIEKIISQSKSVVMKGWYRFPFSKREAINNIIKFDGKSARCGLPLKQFQNTINRQKGRSLG